MTGEPVRLFVQSLPLDAAEEPPLRIPPRNLVGLQPLEESLELALELGDGHALEYTDLYERHDITAFLAEDAARLKTLLAPALAKAKEIEPALA